MDAAEKAYYSLIRRSTEMARMPETITFEPSEEFKKVLAETQEELKAAREALSEERIRQIVREELADWEKRQVQRMRGFFDIPYGNPEAK